MTNTETRTAPTTLAEQIEDARYQLAQNRTTESETALAYYLRAVHEGGECPTCGLLLQHDGCPAGCGYWGLFELA